MGNEVICELERRDTCFLRDILHYLFRSQLFAEIRFVVDAVDKVSEKVVFFRKLEQPLRVEQVPEMEYRRIEIPVFPRIEDFGEFLEWE